MNVAFFFERNPRGTWSLREDRPDWLYDAVQAAHHGMRSNDWIYETCLDACIAFDAGDLDGDSMHDYCDGSVDVYTSRLWQWATDMRGTDLFAEAEERAKDMGDLPRDTDKLFALLQYCAIEIVVATVMLEAIEENSEWLEAHAVACAFGHAFVAPIDAFAAGGAWGGFGASGMLSR